jgi:hypothetical protein
VRRGVVVAAQPDVELNIHSLRSLYCKTGPPKGGHYEESWAASSSGEVVGD